MPSNHNSLVFGLRSIAMGLSCISATCGGLKPGLAGATILVSDTGQNAQNYICLAPAPGEKVFVLVGGAQRPWSRKGSGQCIGYGCKEA